MLIWKIAWRNVLRHKGKSLVVGVILFLGMLIMTVGNAVIEGTSQGLLDNIVNRFSGDMTVISLEQKINDLFFAPHPVKSIKNYLEVKAILEQQDVVEDFMPIARGQIVILNENGVSTNSMVFGVKFNEYRRFFNESLELIEGEWPTPGERGILISDKNRETLFDRQKTWIVPAGVSFVEEHLTPKALQKAKQGRLDMQHDIVLLGQSGESLQTDIRIPVKGIFRFKQLNTVWGNMYSFIDIESYRQAFGHVLASDKSEELSEEEYAILKTDLGDEMFTETNLVEEAELTTGQFATEVLKQQTQRAEPSVAVNLDDGIYSIVMLKLKPGVFLEEARAQLSGVLPESDLGVKLLTYPEMLADLYDIAAIIQGALFVFVLFVFFVAIIIIMNTLSMAALERSGEIGMMRAVGAQKWFISKMFLAETAQLSLIFGGAGIVFGIIMIWILAALNIPVGDNDILGLLFGGDTFHPIVQIGGVGLGLVQLIIVTLMSVLYPIKIARKITPLEAILRD